MLKNYFKVALRNLNKRKGYAAINILGLAIGIASCLFIAAYVLQELSYDRYHEKKERIYRVVQTTKTSTGAVKEIGATTPFPVGPTLKNDYPRRISKTVRFFDMQEEVRTVLNVETKEAFRVDDFYVVDSTFFDVFSAKLIRGNPDNVLKDPMSVVISREQAQLFFGDQNPIGKQLSFKGSEDFTVTGVMEALPENSHFQVDMLASFNSLAVMFKTNAFLKRWYWNPCWTYVQLGEGTVAKELEQSLQGFVDKNYTHRPEGETVSLSLQPLTDIHLYSHLDSEMDPNGSIFSIYLFSAIAVLILVIACINFTNLSTARSIERAREVGLRKVLGATRGQLFRQFMGESFLMTFLGFSVALMMVYLALPWFNDFVGKNLSIGYWGGAVVFGGGLALFALVVLVSGIYPALYLSGFSPNTILRKFNGTGSGTAFQKILVVFQFSLSVILIIGTVIVYLQLQYMQDKNLGFDQEQVVVMPITQTLIAWEFQEFKEKVLNNPSVLEVTGTSKLLGSETQTYAKYSPANRPNAPSSNMVLEVKYDFLKTYNIELLAGRTFSRAHPADADNAIIINKAMLDQIGAATPREALGELFYYTKADGKRLSYKVIGVVQDFNYTSIKKEISPLVIKLITGIYPTVGNIEHASVKLAPGGIRKGIEHIRKVWKEVNHIDPFTYFFHDEKLQKVYATEEKMGKVAGLFSMLCIVVACMGLFGLASFTSSLRTKEIGIRKTLGASIPRIIALLSKDYLKLVVIANFIAWPFAFYLAVQWLQNFPHRIPLGWNMIVIFGLVGLISLLVCMLTVSYQSLRAALVNPVMSIRQE